MSNVAEIAEVTKHVSDAFKGPSHPTTARLVDPDPKDIILCTYPDTLDGFVAAWVVRSALKKAQIPVEFSKECGEVPSRDGRHLIAILSPVSEGAGVDFVTTEKFGRSTVIFRGGVPSPTNPFPIPFAKWERTFPYGIKTMVDGSQLNVGVVADPHRSLCALAWDFFSADRVAFEKRPCLIEHLNDYETSTGVTKYADSATIYACVDSYPRDFATFDRLAEACEDRKRRDLMIVGGQAIQRQMEKMAKLGAVRVEIEEAKQ